MVVTVGLLTSTILVLAFSPLGTVFSERLEHQHSNERRGQLLAQTLKSTVDGSPVVGFGSTRDVQGSFFSIAGGATPDCGACGVPPLGTQGHIWQLIFAQGLVGALLFIAFFTLALTRCWRCRTTAETLCTFVLAFFALLFLIYDTLGMPVLTTMIVIGLVAREQRGTVKGDSVKFLGDALARLRGRWPVLVVLALLGAAVGAGVAIARALQHATRVSILLATSPVFLTLTEDGTPVDASRRGHHRHRGSLARRARVTESRRGQHRPLGAERAA